MKRLLILLLLCTASVSAQTTTVTGTITDPQGNPYQNGTASVQKVVSSGQNPGPPFNTTTNSAGLFSFSGLLALPSPASYIFTICAAPVALGPKANPTPVQQCFANTVPIAISGASQDVSATLNALAPTLGPQVSNITGNALTATSLQNSPAQCGANSLATGITANGTANCTNSPAVTNLTVNTTLNSNGLSTGNVANKPATADAVQYVSASGNDANDGLSLGTAKATLSGAYTALPSCTHYSSFSGGVGNITEPCGRIRFSAGTYTISSTVTIKSMSVVVEGGFMGSTNISCTTSPCITFDPFNAGTTFDSHWYLMSYGIRDLQLSGNGSASQIGVKCINCNGITNQNVTLANFNGTGATGWDNELSNVAGVFAENQTFWNFMWSNNTTNLLFNGQTALIADFDYSKFINDSWMMQTGQTAISLTNFAHCNGSTWIGDTHQQGAVSSENLLVMSGSANMWANWYIRTDVAIPSSITGGANFAPYFNAPQYPAAANTFPSGTGQTVSFEGNQFPTTANAPTLTGGPAQFTSGWKWTFDENSGAFGNTSNSAQWRIPGWFTIFANGSNAVGNDTSTLPDTAGGVSIGNNGMLVGREQNSCTTPGSNWDTICFNITNHDVETSYNNGPFFHNPQVIASGTAVMTTAAITAGNCGATVTGTFVTGSAANILSTDVVSFSPNAAPAGSNAGLISWPIAATSVNFAYCPNSAETPAALTLNWKVVR